MKEGEVESVSIPEELNMRKDLQALDLNQPFTADLADQLRLKGLEVPDRYFTEEELEETLWELLSNK